MQNPIQKFKLSSIFFEKPGILSENLKTVVVENAATQDTSQRSQGKFFSSFLCTLFYIF